MSSSRTAWSLKQGTSGFIGSHKTISQKKERVVLSFFSPATVTLSSTMIGFSFSWHDTKIYCLAQLQDSFLEYFKSIKHLLLVRLQPKTIPMNYAKLGCTEESQRQKYAVRLMPSLLNLGYVPIQIEIPLYGDNV